jgi:hypothetical protein
LIAGQSQFERDFLLRLFCYQNEKGSTGLTAHSENGRIPGKAEKDGFSY